MHSITEPVRTPLFESENALRYERQKFIRDYQDQYDCRLVALIGPIFSDSVTLFEEALHDAQSDKDLHVLLATLGGDGEIALRLVRQARDRCRRLIVAIPDQAKSAGTLFTLGADQILMWSTSDLGPVDPQLLLDNGNYVSAKTIIAAIEEAETRVVENPETFALHASLLHGITALNKQQAHDALKRADGLLREALACAHDQNSKEFEELVDGLKAKLIEGSASHATAISDNDALGLKLPVAAPDADQKQAIWRLWTRYVMLDPLYVYEGERASQIRLQ